MEKSIRLTPKHVFDTISELTKEFGGIPSDPRRVEQMTPRSVSCLAALKRDAS